MADTTVPSGATCTPFASRQTTTRIACDVLMLSSCGTIDGDARWGRGGIDAGAARCCVTDGATTPLGGAPIIVFRSPSSIDALPAMLAVGDLSHSSTLRLRPL